MNGIDHFGKVKIRDLGAARIGRKVQIEDAFGVVEKKNLHPALLNLKVHLRKEIVVAIVLSDIEGTAEIKIVDGFPHGITAVKKEGVFFDVAFGAVRSDHRPVNGVHRRADGSDATRRGIGL